MRLAWLVPPSPFRGILLRRAATLWLIVRLGIAFFLLIYEQPLGAPPAVSASDLDLGVATSLGITALVAGLVLLDALRRRETILLANLGAGSAHILLLAAVPPLLGEAVTWLAPA
jgi:hypothetical protein